MWWQRLSTIQRIAIVAFLVAVLAWILWPSPYSRVRNLGSRGENIVAFGDSLTAGYGAGAGEDYPSYLARMTDRDVINAGVSGDTTADALGRIEMDVLSQNPRVVLVGLGGNDYLRGVSIETTEANLRTIVQKIQDSGAMVILLGFRFPSLTASYEKMYERVAEEERCLFVPDLLDGILGNPSLKSDSIHPNARGYELMAERISGPLEKLWRRADRAMQ